MKTVGILGGMGPQATVLLMSRLIEAMPAQDDADHIPLIVHQNPAVPSRLAHLVTGDGPDPGPVLTRMARDLQAAGAQALAMPCNTAHLWAAQIAAATPLPFLDMRDAVMPALAGAKRVGVLASPAVRISGAFDGYFVAAGLTAIWPEDEVPLALIRAIKASDVGPQVQSDFRNVAQSLAARSDRLLVACTEFSLLTPALAGLDWTDSLDALVAAIMRFARS
jgi:aspartate racemase